MTVQALATMLTAVTNTKGNPKLGGFTIPGLGGRG
jgi:hypothetical protein